MKVKLNQPLNLDGTSYRKGDEVQMKVEDAKPLIRARLVEPVAERAVLRPQMEIRDAGQP